MSKNKGKPNYRLKSIKKVSDDTEMDIFSIANIRNGKCINRRDFLKAGAGLLAALGMTQMLEGCGGGDDKKYSTTKKKLCSVEFYAAHKYPINDVIFNPDGSMIATGCGSPAVSYSGNIRLWNSFSGELLHDGISSIEIVRIIAFSPDGKKIAAVCGKDSGKDKSVIKIINAVTGQYQFQYAGHLNTVSAITFSPDGKNVLSIGPRECHIWEASTGLLAETPKIYVGGTHAMVSYSPDGSKLAIIDGSTLAIRQQKNLKIYDTTTWQLLMDTEYSSEEDYFFQASALSPDWTKVASLLRWFSFSSKQMPDTLNIWNAQTGELLVQYTGPDQGGVLEFSPDGTRIAWAGYNVYILNLQTGLFLQLSEDLWTVEMVRFSPDGSKIVACTQSGIVYIWDAISGQFLMSLKDTSTKASFGEDCDSANRLITDCTCDLVCSCESVCTCDAECLRHFCDCEGVGPCSCDKVCIIF